MCSTEQSDRSGYDHPQEGLKPLVVIVGPTAAGKTQIAIQVAERLFGEIISADSRLFYRGMDIGTAKPSQDERARVPHHLIDIAEPDQVLSLAVFQKLAWEAIDDIHSGRGLPILVGGTGQYVRAVTDAWQVPMVQPNHELRTVLAAWAEELGPQELHRRLVVLDPTAAAHIDWRNVRRTIRALEVIFSTGERFSAQKTRTTPRYHILQIGLIRSRPELYARIDARIQEMLAHGFVEEVRGLLAKGYAPDLPTMSAIGYREIIDYLQGKTTLHDATIQMMRKTRILVRRQANWFKADDAKIDWFMVTDGTSEDVETRIRIWLEQSA